MGFRLEAAIVIPALFVLACGDPTARDTPPKSTPDAGSSQTTPEEQAPSAQDPEEPSQEIMENTADTARPKATARPQPTVPRPSFETPEAGHTVPIPAGSFRSGSHVADLLRDQFAEADNKSVEMTAFEIDALPYPNDPSMPFATAVTQDEAQQKCEQNGKRLCTELEWEYACKGSDNRRYPISNTYSVDDYPPEKPLEPSSPFGVFAMGRILEWTGSLWGQDPSQIERAAVRGHSQGELTNGTPVPDRAGRRCAKRWHRQPVTSAENLGFRCCKGPVNQPVCTIDRPRPAHSLYNNMKPDKFAQVIKSIPELYPIHDNPHMFSDADIRAILARRTTNRDELAKQGIHFRWKPIRWIPRQGMELWVAVGRANKHSFIVALHESVDNEEYVHASSMILWNVPIPLALAYREGHRDQLYWAPCWGCRDGGTIEYDDEKNEIIITHKW